MSGRSAPLTCPRSGAVKLLFSTVCLINLPFDQPFCAFGLETPQGGRDPDWIPMQIDFIPEQQPRFLSRSQFSDGFWLPQPGPVRGLRQTFHHRSGECQKLGKSTPPVQR